MKVNISEQMKSILKNYTDDVVNEVIKEIEQVAKETSEELKTAGTFKGKKYRKSWDYTAKRGRTFASAIVYNKKHYRLTHLLEYGHAKANGGRTRAFTHIEPANKKAEEQAVKKITKAIERLSK